MCEWWRCEWWRCEWWRCECEWWRYECVSGGSVRGGGVNVWVVEV